MPDPSARGDSFLGGVLMLGDVDGDDDIDMLFSTSLEGYQAVGEHPTRLFVFR